MASVRRQRIPLGILSALLFLAGAPLPADAAYTVAVADGVTVEQADLDENGAPFENAYPDFTGMSGDASAVLFYTRNGYGSGLQLQWYLRDRAASTTVEIPANLSPGFVSRDGSSVLYQTYDASSTSYSLFAFDRAASTTQHIADSPQYFNAAMNADGSYVAYSQGTSSSSVVGYDRAAGTAETIAQGDAGDWFSQVNVSPDARYVLYTRYSSQRHGYDVFLYDRTTRIAREIPSQQGDPIAAVMSDDARYVAYSTADAPNVTEHIYLLDRTVGTTTDVITYPYLDLANFQMSGDGRFILYTAGTFSSVLFQVYDRDSGETKTVLTLPYGTTYGLSADGKWIAVASCDPTVNPCAGRHIYLISNPFLPPPPPAPAGCQADCESNVLFIPGLEGSRLYMKDLSGNEEQLWEPGAFSFQSDAKKLYLNPDGTSINDVYTKAGGAIDTTLAGDIYKTFFEQLAGLKANGTIADYGVFPYDWRMSPTDVVNEGTPYDDGTHYIDQALISLAASSKSGKVTIVAHSNGGLVAKALMEKLQQDGKANLVDKIIFVDVPQLGAPKAIAAMLHGDGESIGWPDFPGLVISQANARALGENMPDGYDLLPSDAYFARVATPVADLTLAPDLKNGSGVGNTISTSTDLAKFLTTGRAKPSYADIETPDLLSASLLSQADALHSDLDSWVPPSGVQVIQIAGWGLDTADGVVYQELQTTECSISSCTTATTTRHAVSFTEDGDNTVVTPSQTAMSGWPIYYINLAGTNGFGHGTIMGMPAFENLFALLLASSSPTTLPAYITTSQPPATAAGNSLRLRVLSPVTLDAYDSEGRHTGMALNPIPGSDLGYIEQQIPGSYYERYGEGQYIGLSAEGDYKIVMNGTGTGTFTFELTPVSRGVAQQAISYADIPVTASTTATVEISGADPASSTLAIDINGDGVVDTTLASSSESTDPRIYIGLMQTDIAAMVMGKNVQKHLQDDLKNVAHTLDENAKWLGSHDGLKDKDAMHRVDEANKEVGKQLDTMEEYVEKRLGKNNKNEYISPDQAAAIITVIERLKMLINQEQ